MFQKICVIVIITLPTLRAGVSIGKALAKTDATKSTEIISSLLYMIATYVVLFYAGILTLLKQ